MDLEKYLVDKKGMFLRASETNGLNKKGMFFTILAMILISLFVLSLVVFSDFTKRESTKQRVETLDNLVSAFDDDLPRRVYLIGFRTIFLAEKKIIEEGENISDLNALVNETFFLGTFEGNDYDSILNGATFNDTLDYLRGKADKISANVTINNPQLTVYQDDPWNVKLNFTGQLILEDYADVAAWDKPLNIIVEIPVSSFNDPLYLLNTNGFMTQKVIQTPYTDFVDGSNVDNLKSHLNGAYYIASHLAPSFIDRLEGINAPSTYGVESLVNLNNLSILDIPVREGRSVVDYIYFSDVVHTSCNVLPAGMPRWFRL